jgi:4-amino-4-deoxy-L-arabinose transferase-like glycosyltransferase
LYLYGLNAVGVFDPDEPRYLAIGRAMAQTGDFVTPKLWSTPWFEKPPLLYWMTSLGTFLHLGPELSGRLPVAMLSLCFLLVMFFLLAREFGVAAAGTASVFLATSVGWIAYSSLALTDLPMAVFYSVAVFLALPLIENRPSEQQREVKRFALIGAALGLATLAKGLVPIALALPFAWYLRRWWRSWPIAAATAAAVALPWYVSVYLCNGRVFLEDFFWKHHFERLYSASLQHVQPWWYYFPVAIGVLYPWTPLFALLLFYRKGWDQRRSFLAACFLVGFLLFSISLNKLPGYLLPLLPASFALLGASVDWSPQTGWFRAWLLPSAVLIGLLPLLSSVLPETLQLGRIGFHGSFHIVPTEFFYIAAPIAVILLARRTWIGILLVLCLVASGFFLKIVSYPVLEHTVSARSLWPRLKNVRGTICDDWLDRNWAYGLALYRGAPYPVCSAGKYDFALQSHGKGIPILVPLKKQ